MRRITCTILVAFSTVLLAACGSSDKAGGIRGVSSRDADRLNAQRSSFERSDDPPFTADTHFAAGRLAETQNAFPQAIAQYNQALKMDPNHRPSLYRLGVVYSQLRQFPQATDAWQRYIKASGNDAAAYSNLGYTHELAGDPASAEQAYLKGIQIDPKNEPCQVNLGLLLARTGRMNEAEQHLSAVLPPAQVRYNIGSVHEQLGQKDQARAEYRRALELDPGLDAAKTRLASIGD